MSVHSVLSLIIHSFSLSHSVLVPQHCRQLDRLWALVPCVLIDFEKDPSRTLSPLRGSYSRPHHRPSSTTLEPCIRTRGRRHCSDIIALSRPRRHIHSGHLRLLATSTYYHPYTRSTSWSAFLVNGRLQIDFLWFCVLTVSDGSDSPPYLRVIGSSAPPRL